MNSSKTRFAILSVLITLLLTTIACATIIGPDPLVAADNTPAPVIVGDPATPAPLSTEPDNTATPGDENDTIDPTPALMPPDGISPPANLEQLFIPYWETWGIIHGQYVDQPVDDLAMMNGSIKGLHGFLEFTETTPSTDIALDFAVASGTPTDLQNIYVPFWQAWIDAAGAAKNTADGPTEAELLYAAIHGMLGSLGDQHTSYMDPDQFVQANIPLEGEYEGIGAWVDPDGEYLTIVSPMPGSPAEEVGLQPGDEIIKIDGEDMTGIDGNLVIRRVLGPAGSEVVLSVQREGETELLEFTITRGRITIPSVTGQIIEDTNIAHIQLMTFGETTADDLREVLSDLLSQNPDGLILDLRNNGGGYLSTAIGVVSEFIGDGVVMYERYGDGSEDVYDALRGGLAPDIPMVVLINGGSASASEIVAGAIQDYGRAMLVGTTSFGKGSVQNWIPLSHSQGAVRVTIARWYTPNERLIHEVGLEPDIIVEFTEEDVEAGNDPQLDKAVEILTSP